MCITQASNFIWAELTFWQTFVLISTTVCYRLTDWLLRRQKSNPIFPTLHVHRSLCVVDWCAFLVGRCARYSLRRARWCFRALDFVPITSYRDGIEKCSDAMRMMLRCSHLTNAGAPERKRGRSEIWAFGVKIDLVCGLGKYQKWGNIVPRVVMRSTIGTDIGAA